MPANSAKYHTVEYLKDCGLWPSIKANKSLGELWRILTIS
jgi:hypothetical protein